jgi:hypothetical protein
MHKTSITEAFSIGMNVALTEDKYMENERVAFLSDVLEKLRYLTDGATRRQLNVIEAMCYCARMEKELLKLALDDMINMSPLLLLSSTNFRYYDTLKKRWMGRKPNGLYDYCFDGEEFIKVSWKSYEGKDKLIYKPAGDKKRYLAFSD